MNKGSDHDHVIWENQGWLISNTDNIGWTIAKSVDDKLSNPSSSDSQPQAAAKKRKAAASGSKTTKNGSNRSTGEEKCGGGRVDQGESDHEIHILTERERRKKMRNMFSNLHALLPQLPPKADKSTIVDEAVSYIKTLENTLQKLQKQKLEKLYGMSATINYDPSIIASHNLLGADMSSFEAFLADQGSSSNSAAITPTNQTAPSPLLIPGLVPPTFQTWISPNVILNVCGDEAHISVCCLKKHGLLSAICCVLEKYKIEMVSAQVSSDHYRSMFMIQTHASGGGSSDQYSEILTVEEAYKRAAREIMLWATSK